MLAWRLAAWLDRPGTAYQPPDAATKVSERQVTDRPRLPRITALALAGLVSCLARARAPVPRETNSLACSGRTQVPIDPEAAGPLAAVRRQDHQSRASAGGDAPSRGCSNPLQPSPLGLSRLPRTERTPTRPPATQHPRTMRQPLSSCVFVQGHPLAAPTPHPIQPGGIQVPPQHCTPETCRGPSPRPSAWTRGHSSAILPHPLHNFRPAVPRWVTPALFQKPAPSSFSVHWTSSPALSCCVMTPDLALMTCFLRAETCRTRVPPKVRPTPGLSGVVSHAFHLCRSTNKTFGRCCMENLNHGCSTRAGKQPRRPWARTRVPGPRWNRNST